ncbi:uncharacterized protein GGS22DRAFT_196680 [Annulohypoxylon maeteangense]|uniref:uncharacterized protein n=1 Tax=Annulohypoxylon maeteangense TaxID=1927788 RepID=UPI00200762FF|nr:uncharacterized protein GGS22DRAFT_196680 [Annulohypoxylon maeteangense]KAI0888825.1 hypothetical protein GGS22DRAFT_196680 [Annulohypoxylon maeteangense]
MIDVEETFKTIAHRDHQWDYCHEEGHLKKYSGMVTTTILLTDRRREIFVTAPASFTTNEAWGKNLLFKKLYKIFRSLSPKALMLRLDADGLLEELSSDPAEFESLRERSPIQTLADIPKPLLSDTPFSTWPTLQRTELIELDRFTCNVDLVKLAGQTEASLVAKYIFDDNGMMFIWHEINMLMALQPHPSILPLDRIILGDKGHIIGITTRYIRGGTISSKKDRVVKLKWLKQLTEVLDFLHLDQGVIHGDLKLDNILIDEESDRLLLCDFERSRKALPHRMDEELSNAVWVLYSLITQDYDAIMTQFWETWAQGRVDLDSEVIERLPAWPLKAKLDCDLKEFKEHLGEWLNKRRETLDDREPKNDILMEWEDKQHFPRLPHLAHIPLDPVMAEGRWVSKAVDIDWERPPYEEAYPDKAPKKEEPESKLTYKQQIRLEPFSDKIDEIEAPYISVQKEPDKKRKTSISVENQPPLKKSKTPKVENGDEKGEEKEQEQEQEKGKGKAKGKGKGKAKGKKKE